MDIILAEPLTYDNAVRYEKYGFDYLSGRRKMQAIDREFKPGGILFRRLDGSTPFRQPGMERTVHGRSWAVHDGIMDDPWENILIYKTIGVHAGVNTFTVEA
jgi:acetoin utilization protein AcuC